MSLAEFKSYFDEEVMRILGQMDEPSKILDYLYLGSEWNASNLEELQKKGIGYILNVTREIDNFFVGKFQYYNVRVLDVEQEELLKHWDKTYKFITKARNHSSKVLVHCKMGVSRSASTVMAYLMKEKRWTVTKAYDFVKEKRSCVNPNTGFMEQLSTYEGILTASNQRDIFRSKSNQNLLEENPAESLEVAPGSFLGTSLFTMMSHPDWSMASGGVAQTEEWLSVNTLSTDFSAEHELEVAASRSADSIEDSVPDIRTPPPSEVPPATEFTSDFPSSRMLHPASRPSLGFALTAKFHLMQKYDSATNIDSSDTPASDSQTFSYSNSHVLISHFGDVRSDSPGTSASENHFVAASGQLPVSTNKPQLINPSPSKLFIVGDDDAKHEHAKFSIGDTHISTGTASGFTGNIGSRIPNYSVQNSVHFVGSKDNFDPVTAISSSVLQLSTDRSETDTSETVSSDIPQVNDIAEKDHFSLSGGGDKPEIDQKTTKINVNSIEKGVRQYFIKEKIPWNIGKVKKMREDINKTGQILQELDLRSPVQESAEFKAKELSDDHNLLDRAAQHHHPTLSQSHSCMELSSMTDMDPIHLTLYEREEIPLEPGTVKRTKQEIEQRQRVLSGEGDEETFYTYRPVQRSSSLKHEGESKFRFKHYRRLTCGPILSPIWGKSLNDLSNLEVSDHKLASFKGTKQALPEQDFTRAAADVTLHMLGDEATPIKSGLVRKQKLELESRYEPDKVQCKMLSSPEMNVSGLVPSFNSPEVIMLTELQVKDSSQVRVMPRDNTLLSDTVTQAKTSFDPVTLALPSDTVTQAKSCFDPKTLALIREIGSALLRGPTSPKLSEKSQEQCTNKVKYFVRKIEKKTCLGPHFEIPLPDSDNKYTDDKSQRNTIPSPLSEQGKKLTSSDASLCHGKNICNEESRPLHFKSDKDCNQRSAVRPSLEDRHNIAPSSFKAESSCVAYAGNSASAIQSVPSASHHSLAQAPSGDPSAEPSVVRHLVGKFESPLPDADLGAAFSAGLSNEVTYRGKDFHSGTTNFPLPVTSNTLASDSPTSHSSDRCPKTGSQDIGRTVPSLASSLSSSSSAASGATGSTTRQLSLDAAGLHSSSPGEIKVEIFELTDTVTKHTSASSNKMGKFPVGSQFDRPVPAPFNKDCGSEHRTWRPVRPSSAECSSSDYDSSLSSDRSKGRRSLGSEEFPHGDEGIKIRRLQGRSHPLTKLSENHLGKGHF
ncbi:hypothetical protein Btru_002296 [Bulinus truncatus]|nr:hypothetical protein Btru_002296 [Bulinus truncatus]